MTKQESFNRYTGTLFYAITHCERTTKLIKRVRSKTIAVSDEKAKSEILERLAEQAVLKIDCLFDTRKDAVSFERIHHEFQKDLPLYGWTAFKKGWAETKKKHSALIARLGNNRNAKIGHISNKELLGWDEVATKRLNEIFQFKGAALLKPVSPENVHIAPSNFPHAEFHALLIDMQHLLFHELIYPLVKKPANKELYGSE